MGAVLALAVLLPFLAVKAPQAAAIQGGGTPEEAPVVCGSRSLDAQYSQVGSAPVYGGVWIPAGGTVTFSARGELLPSTYVGNGRGEYEMHVRVRDPETQQELWTDWNYKGVGIQWGAGPYDWVPFSGVTIGSWTNTTGRSGFFQMEMWARRSYAGADLRWSVDARVGGAPQQACLVLPRLPDYFGTNPAMPGHCPCRGATDHSVDTGSGNEHWQLPGVAIAGRGPGIDLALAYNSLDTSYDGPIGHGWRHSYDMQLVTEPDGTVTVRQETGSTVGFAPDDGGGWVAPRRFDARLTEHASGWTFERGHFELFDFDADGRLVAVRDRNGETTALGYVEGRLSTVEDPAGRRITFRWLDGRVSSVEESAPGVPLGRTVSMDYDADGNLVGYVDVSGGPWSLDYDDRHRLVAVRSPGTTPESSSRQFGYDEQGRVAWEEDALGRRTTLRYDDPVTGATSVVDPEGDVEVHHYDALGRRTKVTTGSGTPDAATTQFAYDAETFMVVERLDGRGRRWRRSYEDPRHPHLPTATVDPLGRTRRTTYNELGQPLTMTDAAGTVTQLSYDLNGNLERVTDAVGTVEEAGTEYVRDPEHPQDVVTVVDAAGHAWHATHDPATGDVLSRTDPLGNRTGWEYNHLGWVTAMQAPGADTVRSSMDYDERGNVVRAVDPLGGVTTRAFDANGNLVEETGPDGTVTVHRYNVANELVSTTSAAASAAESTTEYDYYPDGRMQSWSVAGSEWAYDYDASGRLVQRADPHGKVTSMDHDASGNVVALTQPGGDCTASEPHGCVRYRYDDADQLTAIEYSDPETPDVAFAYDLNGRKVTERLGQDPTATWDWTALGRLSAHTDPEGRQVRYTWTAMGAVDSILYPGQQIPVRYGYDAAGRMTSVSDWLGNTTTFDHDPRSNLVNTHLGDAGGTTVSRSHDLADRLATVSWGQDGAIGTMAYDRQVDGLVRTVTERDLSDGARSTAYAYDERDRLGGVDENVLAYDAHGNLARRADGVHQAFDAAQQLCWASGSGPGECASPPADAATYRYDAHGNRVHETAADGLERTLTFDQANRLRAAHVERWELPDQEILMERVLEATVDAATPAIEIAGNALRTQNLDALFDTLASVQQLLVGLPLDPAGPVLGLPQTLQNLATTLGSAASLVDTVVDPDTQTDIELLVAESGDLVEELSRYSQFGELTELLEQLSDVATELTATVTGLRNELTGSLRLTADLLDVAAALLIDGDATAELHDGATRAVTMATELEADLAQLLELGQAIQSTVAELVDGPPQLEPVPVPVGADWTYRYDADGLRRAKTGPEGTTSFVWDRASGLPLLLTVETGEGSTHLIYGPGRQAITQIGPDDQPLWYHHDHLGSTRVTTDQAGEVTGRRHYGSHGTATDTGTSTPMLGYAGEYIDTETGYIYLRARYYDPTTGQFLTRDPLVGVTQDPYGYALNNPVNATDPTGLFGIPEWVPVVGGKCVAIGDPNCDNSGSRRWAGNVLAGAGNALTFGQGVDLAARLMGKGDNFTDCYADTSSWAYRGGQIGGSAFGLAFGAGAAGSSTRVGDAAYRSRFVGADSYVFGNQSLGTHARVGGGLLNPATRGGWRLGWGVNDVPVFRLKAAGRYFDLLVTSGF